MADPLQAARHAQVVRRLTRVRQAYAAPPDRFFRQVLGSMRSAVIVIHRDGLLAVANDEAYRIFSLPPHPGDIGRPFVDAFRERPELIQVLSRAFDAPASLPNRAELRLTVSDRVIGHTLSQVRDRGNRVVGAVLVFKDLTHAEHLKEQARLRDRLASLGEMAASIAHELKNPLGAIAVQVGLLRRGLPDSADAQSIVADILAEIRSATAIVDEVLAFVRPVRMQMERASVVEVLRRAMIMAQGADLQGGTTIHLEVPATLPLVFGDQDQLCQVFSNLVRNALEALGGGGRIDITAALMMIERESAFPGDPDTQTPAIVIDIVDDGPGVPADLIDRIFDPFFTTKLQGVGIGLSIVRKIVDAHDGRIDPTRIAGGGMRFRVTLPAA